MAREVWSWNLDEEFDALLQAVYVEGSATLAVDTEFPGVFREESQAVSRAVQYEALRENVDLLQPIQLGFAVAGADGEIRGVWSFNLAFDLAVDLHTEDSVEFLTAAGIDFPRHAMEGIDTAAFGMKLGSSPLLGNHASSPWWVTFSGSYDLGYLLKLITVSRLPHGVGGFDAALASYCPRRHELRDQLPHGSLETHVKQRGIQRCGVAHTAGCDALATLELFHLVVSPEDRAAATAAASFAATAAFRNTPKLRSSHWREVETPHASVNHSLHFPRGGSSQDWEAAALQAYLCRPGGGSGALPRPREAAVSAASGSVQEPTAFPGSSWGDAARQVMTVEASNGADTTRECEAAPPSLWGQLARQAERQATIDAEATTTICPESESRFAVPVASVM